MFENYAGVVVVIVILCIFTILWLRISAYMTMFSEKGIDIKEVYGFGEYDIYRFTNDFPDR